MRLEKPFLFFAFAVSGVFGRPVPAKLEEPMQHAERLCAALARLEQRRTSERARA